MYHITKKDLEFYHLPEAEKKVIRAQRKCMEFVFDRARYVQYPKKHNRSEGLPHA